MSTDVMQPGCVIGSALRWRNLCRKGAKLLLQPSWLARFLASLGFLRSGRRDGILILFASQSGTAERFALRSAEVLEAGGVPTSCRALAEFGIDEFRAHSRVLIVASTFGEGESPESVRGFALQAAQHDLALPDLHYAVLALGDRSFKNFCGFGRFLDDALSASGAHRLFPTIEVDRGDSEALKRWSLQLHALIEGS